MLQSPSEAPLKTSAQRMLAYVHSSPMQICHKVSGLLNQRSQIFTTANEPICGACWRKLTYFVFILFIQQRMRISQHQLLLNIDDDSSTSGKNVRHKISGVIRTKLTKFHSLLTKFRKNSNFALALR